MENFDVKIKRWKALAELFLKNDERVYIKDIDDNFYFADILLVGEDALYIQCFEPIDRQGKKFTLYWPLIVRIDKYNDEKEGGA